LLSSLTLKNASTLKPALAAPGSIRLIASSLVARMNKSRSILSESHTLLEPRLCSSPSKGTCISFKILHGQT
ncbi:polyadenylate-binding protein 2, partial [Moniliophthora roreri]